MYGSDGQLARYQEESLLTHESQQTLRTQSRHKLSHPLLDVGFQGLCVAELSQNDAEVLEPKSEQGCL